MNNDGLADDMFAFEVPTPKGRARIILPEDLSHAEGKKLGTKLAAILDAMFQPTQTAEEHLGISKRFSNGNAAPQLRNIAEEIAAPTAEAKDTRGEPR